MKQIRLMFFALLPLIIFSTAGRTVAGEYRVYPVPSEVQVSTGEESFVTLVFDIPGNHHIYGNPVGTGTGKPTTIMIKQDAEGVVFQAPRFPEARIYYAPGDKGYVRIYEKEGPCFFTAES